MKAIDFIARTSMSFDITCVLSASPSGASFLRLMGTVPADSINQLVKLGWPKIDALAVRRSIFRIWDWLVVTQKVWLVPIRTEGGIEVTMMLVRGQTGNSEWSGVWGDLQCIGQGVTMVRANNALWNALVRYLTGASTSLTMAGLSLV